VASIDSYTLKDGSRRWRVRIRRDGFQPIVQRGFAKKKDAEQWAVQAEANLRERELFGADRLTLRDAIAAYRLRELPELAETERPNRIRHLNWWEARRGDVRLRDLTRSDIREDIRALRRGDEGASLTGRPVKFATANRYEAALSAVLSMCVDEEWLEANPLRNPSRRKRTKSEQEAQRDREITPEEFKAIWRETQKSRDPRLYPLALCAYASGARQGELMSLQWADVVLFPRVYDPTTRKHRPGAPQARVRKTKNGRDRILYFGGLAGDWLREYAKKPHLSRFVFAEPGAPPSDTPPKFPTMAWRRALERAKLVDLRFHDIRHSWACDLVDNGTPDSQLMALGGWRSSTMIRIYASRAQQKGSAAAERPERPGLVG